MSDLKSPLCHLPDFQRNLTVRRLILALPLWMVVASVAVASVGLSSANASSTQAQEASLRDEKAPTPDGSATPREQFIPANELEAVFNRDQRGVLMKRDEFKALLEQARANVASTEIPVPILIEHAQIKVTPGDQQAIVTMEFKVRQYAEGWQTLAIRAGNLLVEKIEIDNKSALTGRDPSDPGQLLLVHDKVGEFTVVATMSTPLVTVGSDRSAAFDLPIVAATQLNVACPAGRHLMVNDLQLDRPAAEDQNADYTVPVGVASNVRLRWVVERKESEAQTLVFVRTDAQLQVQKETLRWESDSRISVFGGSINQLVAQVPSRLEVTSIESAGLESWTLDDDPENAGQTRVTLTYRQPFTNDRVVRVKAVATNVGIGDAAGQARTDMPRIPTLTFSQVTTHTGRLVITHEDGLRLVSETEGGVRRISAAEVGLSTEASVFDFWLQQFELKVAAKPRDRELFAESNGLLTIDDTRATFQASVTIETLNAPLFEIQVTLPVDWQLQSVANSANQPPGFGGSAALTWAQGSQPNVILVKPAQPIAPGQLLPIIVTLVRTISDPDTEQKLALPVVTVAETSTVGGTYTVRFADDLVVSPLTLTGLTPIAGNGTEQVFQNPGTDVSGELSIIRKPSRLAARSVLKTWADSRQQSFDGEIIADVLSGTIRTLTIRLSESLGPDVRFSVRNVGPVPGVVQTRAIQPVTIIEQSAGTPLDGLRPFTLKLDHRFAGSLSLHASIQQSRDPAAPIAAPIVQVQDAVRQHGVLVFEALPEQQLSTGPEVRSIPGLFSADAGVVEAPDVSTGRRIALTFRFVQPDYAFQVAETRFETSSVPAAVCEHIANVCTLNDSGNIQRWCQAKVRSSGVQTLRFTLPGGEESSFLWSTMLNGEPVEVRRDGADYLVAVPSTCEGQQYSLTVLFESAAATSGRFGQTDQEPVQLSIDAGEQNGIPIDVLKQSWRVHYPQSSLLVDSEGQFQPTDGVDQPGWLASMSQITWPEVSRLPERLLVIVVYFLVLFVLTVMVGRRRWKTLAGLTAGGLFLMLFLLMPTVQKVRESARRTSVSNQLKQSGMAYNAYSMDAVGDMEPMDAPAPGGELTGMGGYSTEELEARNDPFGDIGGLGGAPASAASPSQARGGRDAEMAGEPNSGAGLPVPLDEKAGVQLFDSALSLSPAEKPRSEDDVLVLTPGQFSPPNAAFGGDASGQQVVPLAEKLFAPESKSSEQSVAASVPRKGVARLSVNVALDVPAEYRVREFVSVADAVHQPSVLSIMVQRREQIAAIRLLSALIVLAIAWCMRRSGFLWKMTVALIMLLAALALLPLLSNAWQSVLDGIAAGAILAVCLALLTSCCQCCGCPLDWFRSWFNKRQTT